MKKIKSIKQLKSEKKKIEQQQEELEDRIRCNWKELKESLRPGNIASQAFSSILKNKTEETLNGESVLKSAFTFGVTILAQKFAEKTGDKLDKLFKN